MLEAVSRVLLALVAALNVVPVVVTLAPDRAVRLYGLDPRTLADPVSLVLLRHRGVLFGLISIWLGAAVVLPELRPWAIGSALAAKTAFLVLFAGEPRVRGPLARVAWADVIASGMLLALAVMIALPPS